MHKEEKILNQGDILSLYDDEYEVLQKILRRKGIHIDAANFTREFIKIPRQYVGFLELSNRKIYIRPKINGLTLQHIIRMYYLVFFNNEIDADENLLGLADGGIKSIVELYVNELTSVLKTGLVMRYSSVNKLSKYMKGKIDIIETQKRIEMKKQIVFKCNYFELNKNSEINQLLFSAYKKIEDLVDVSLQGFFNSKFQEVSRLDRDPVKPTITRDVKYCEKAILLAYMILNDLTILGSGDSDYGENLLINFDLLFEQFIQKILITYSNDQKFSVWYEKHKYGDYDDGNKIKEYVPDLLYNYRKTIDIESATCILDMKNKDSSPFSNPDVYQMCFYASILNCKKVILCYPSASKIDNKKLDLFNDGIELSKIYACYMNLAGNTSSEFRSNILEFIEKIFGIIDNY